MTGWFFRFTWCELRPRDGSKVQSGLAHMTGIVSSDHQLGAPWSCWVGIGSQEGSAYPGGLQGGSEGRQQNPTPGLGESLHQLPQAQSVGSWNGPCLTSPPWMAGLPHFTCGFVRSWQLAPSVCHAHAWSDALPPSRTTGRTRGFSGAWTQHTRPTRQILVKFLPGSFPWCAACLGVSVSPSTGGWP